MRGVHPQNGSNNFATASALVSAKSIRYPINSRTGLFNETAFGSNHPGGAHFAMGDAAVRFVGESIDFATYLGTASRDGEEPVGSP